MMVVKGETFKVRLNHPGLCTEVKAFHKSEGVPSADKTAAC